MSDYTSELLDFAADLAIRAGAVLRAGIERERTIEAKSYHDIVSDIDKASEQLLVDTIHQQYPGDRILAEEGSNQAGETRTWLIDPLDGTLNYVHGFPFCSISIGVLQGDTLLIGVVYDPFREELFSARREHGAYCNGRRLRVSQTDELRRALVTTGFPYNRFDNPDNNLAEFSRVLMQVQDVRRAGSAALDLCYAAAGRSDGHWELGLQPWDCAAGALIVHEAGGMVSGWGNQDWDPWSPKILATNGRIHEQLSTLLGSR
jgi:myo-inositol-1(or 4)-monophosphatase